MTAVADTYARSNAVNTNFGTQTTMQGFQQTGTQYQPYFRFSVGALPATPVSAKVRLFVTDPSNTSGNLYQTANATWTETGLTWSNRPATTGSLLFGTQQAALGQWVEFDVTPVGHRTR